MITVLYVIVILLATTLGSFVGLGGGVVIKPILDFIGAETRAQVDFLSCVSVLTMSVISTGKHLKNKVEFDKNIIYYIAFGSVGGGFLGNYCINLLGNINIKENIIRSIQAFVLCLLLSFVCFYIRKQKFSFHLKNRVLIFITGLSLGFIASFLGIGGGPINVAFLTLFFSMSVKESAVYSVAIIFFSQLSKLMTVFAMNGISDYAHQWKTLIFILPASVVGGLSGAAMNRKFDDSVIRKVFIAVIVLIIILNVYNCIYYLNL